VVNPQGVEYFPIEHVPMKELPPWLKLGTVWLLLGLGLFLGVQGWQRHEQSTRFVVAGTSLELRRADDGHYHWPGSLQGQAVDFLVDTGATGTAIPADLARRLGLEVVGQVTSQTAGGRVEGQVVVGDLVLQGGVRVQRLRLTALPDLKSPLLGMDVLGRLRWEQHQGVMKIKLKEPAS